MTFLPLRCLWRTAMPAPRGSRLRVGLVVGFATVLVPLARATTPTVTALTISSTAVAYKNPVILTATVTSGGTPVRSGLVFFCDATATFCGNNSAIGTVQLTTGASAVLRLGSGSLGNHSYKAVFRANNSYLSSTSNTVTYSVKGTYASITAVSSTGSVGAYTLSAGVFGVGSPLIGPTGDFTFLDTSAGNKVLGMQPLGVSGLSQAFAEAMDSPFTIATSATTRRSVALASAYLNGDNNLDIVTGDAQGTITVLLGNGDGTFQPKVTYPGCPTGRALKVLLADFNRDGNPDVALGCSDSNNGSLTILLGNGDGSFQLPVQYTAGDVAGLAMGDFDGDGVLDLVVSDRMQQNVMLFTGNGDGTFKAGVIALSASAQLHDVGVADFNGDGKDDVFMR